MRQRDYDIKNERGEGERETGQGICVLQSMFIGFFFSAQIPPLEILIYTFLDFLNSNLCIQLVETVIMDGICCAALEHNYPEIQGLGEVHFIYFLSFVLHSFPMNI